MTLTFSSNAQSRGDYLCQVSFEIPPLNAEYDCPTDGRPDRYQSYFSFNLPSVLLKKRAEKIDIKYKNHANLCHMVK